MLKAIVTQEEFAALSASDQAHYTKKEDGKFYLTVQGVDGWKLEDVNALNNALERERENVKTEKKARTELEAKVSGIDIEQAKKLIERAKSGKGDDNSQAAIDAAIAEISKKKDGEHDVTKQTLALRDSQLERVLIDLRAQQAIGAEEGNAVLLLPHVRSQCKIIQLENGEMDVRVVDEKGVHRRSMEPDNNGPMGIQELVKTMKKQAEFKAAFKGTGNTGSGRGAGTEGGGTSNLSANPKSPYYNLTKLSQLAKDDPAEYKRLRDAYVAEQAAAAAAAR